MKHSMIIFLVFITASILFAETTGNNVETGLTKSVPNLIDYQGRITDSSNDPITTPVSIVFAIYDNSVDGTQLWSETHTSVTPVEGLVHVLLGSESAFASDLFDGSERWLGIKVGGDNEMTPRLKIVSSPYAIHSDNADFLDGNHGAYYLDWNNSTNVPADILDGDDDVLADLSCADGQIAKWNAASSAWECASDISSYYTASTGIQLLGNDFQHVDTSTQSSLSNVNGTVVEDLVFDSFGHVTGVTSYNLDGRYFTEIESNEKFINKTGDTMTGQLMSVVSSGTSPFVITSPTLNYNLNADMLDGLHASSFMTAATDNWVNIWGDTMTGTLKIIAGGVEAETTSTNGIGVYGEAKGNDYSNKYGVYGLANGSGTNYGIYGKATMGTTNYAGYFDGDVRILGTTTMHDVLHLTPMATAPTFPSNGDIYVGTDNHIYCYLKGVWKQLDN